MSIDWREHSAGIAKGEKCPDTLETLQAAWARDQELILDQKAEISRLKATVNQLRQKRTARASGTAAVAWRLYDGEGGYTYTEDPETVREWADYLGGPSEQYKTWIDVLIRGSV